ncbi:MAG: hypothetical protein ACRCTI_06045 [Beijerinckiaceae bacterium]
MPVWKPLHIDGRLVDLSHLEPFAFEVAPVGAALPVPIEVQFNDHCFSIPFDPARHSAALTRDHIAGYGARAFDDDRFGASKMLPAIIRDLGGKRIFTTRRDSLHLATLPDGRLYAIFFNLRRIWGRRVTLFVVSAVPWSGNRRPAVTGGMSFNVALAKALRGERTRFKRLSPAARTSGRHAPKSATP